MRQSSRRILNLIFELLLRRESSKKMCAASCSPYPTILSSGGCASFSFRFGCSNYAKPRKTSTSSGLCVCVCGRNCKLRYGLTFITFGWRVCQHHSRRYAAIHLLCKVKPNTVMSIVLELASFACSRTQLTCSWYVLLSYNFHFLVRRRSENYRYTFAKHTHTHLSAIGEETTFPCNPFLI